ncbi:hypothetical protein FKZ61_021815 [Litorilinea aerophila]|uniref:Sel1 repeat family protein n=1 Tax=Litorilinea aerophila TaxID=1204385 RepID=A0A540VBG6_9CHLR|nr:hypothetical protein [Litorilinea aerophila]MCC9078737.1 hypothetical protein [Litorilinea aerophila]OUC05447.1 hypothetical protein RY27_27270 [Litorilinea aerophila]GIV78320.1 MAG: hypothetical protein KatS3mg050_2714 [Litorilinea sp.]
MTLEEFRQSLEQAQPPAGLSLALQALWHEARGEWDKAHSLAQAQDDATGAWVHAYLHRVEGDPGNAAYWYRRAGKPVSHQSLAEEWESIAQALLAE